MLLICALVAQPVKPSMHKINADILQISRAALTSLRGDEEKHQDAWDDVRKDAIQRVTDRVRMPIDCDKDLDTKGEDEQCEKDSLPGNRIVDQPPFTKPTHFHKISFESGINRSLAQTYLMCLCLSSTQVQGRGYLEAIFYITALLNKYIAYLA